MREKKRKNATQNCKNSVIVPVSVSVDRTCSLIMGNHQRKKHSKLNGSNAGKHDMQQTHNNRQGVFEWDMRKLKGVVYRLHSVCTLLTGRPVVMCMIIH